MRVRSVALAVVVSLLAGCYEDPVTETLLIQMLPEGKVAATATMKLAGISDDDEPRRLSQLRQDIARGMDPWMRRFERVDFEHEKRTVYRGQALGKELQPVKGRYYVSRVDHMVILPREELQFLMNDSGVAVMTRVERGRGQLLIAPGAGSLATPEQRRVLQKWLQEWAESAAAYFREVEKLYGYLETAPDRAPALFAAVFKDISEEEFRKANPLGGAEEEMASKAHEAMVEMAKKVEWVEELEYGLNELSYLVYDPLPAAVTVCLPTRADHVEGFTATGDLCYSVPRRGIVDAFDALEGRWIAPDPFVSWIGIHRSSGEKKLDLVSFAAKARAVQALPTAAAIVDALETGMRHEPLYRLEWIEAEAR